MRDDREDDLSEERSEDRSEARSEARADDLAGEKPRVLEYRTPDLANEDAARLVILTRLRLSEAELARIKLESEDIPCLIRDSATAVANSFIVPEVPILVRAEDLDRAKEVLARPADDSMEGEYADEEYRCPKCHRRDVELVPLSAKRRRLRALWIAVLASPLAWMLIRGLAGGTAQRIRNDEQFEWLTYVWLALAIGVGVAVMWGRRVKRCRTCRHTWTRTDSNAQ